MPPIWAWAAEELIFNTATTVLLMISKSTKLARDMVTRYGMSEEFGMMALETINNQYLGAIVLSWYLLKLLPG